MSIKLRVELRLPTVLGGTLTEGALFTSEGGSEDSAIVLELSGVASVLSDVIPEGLSIRRSTTRQDTN